METIARAARGNSATTAGPVTCGNDAAETVDVETAYLCPRCGEPERGHFYGPCQACRMALRAKYAVPDLAATAEPERVRPTVSGLVTVRRWWRHERRPAVFTSTRGGHDSAGRRVDVPPMTQTAAYLSAVAGWRNVFACHADAAADVRAMMTATADGWTRTGAHAHDAHPSVTWRRDADGATVRVSPFGAWRPGVVETATAAEAWRWTDAAVSDATGGVLLATPSTTGRDTLARLFPKDVELPTLADDLAEQIRSTSTQHRMELVTPPGAIVPAMYELDMRLAFAAVLRNLPAGEPERVKGEPIDYLPNRHGRYLCRWNVPDGWNGPGALPTLTADGWRWPSRPGEAGAGWVDGAELALARRYGWTVAVAESVLWPTRPTVDPCRTWAEKMTGLYAAAEAGPAGITGDAAAVARSMIRAIIIHAIGSLRGNGQRVTRTATPETAAAKGADKHEWWTLEDGTVVWVEHHDARWAEWVRPEWTAAIWARNRCRLLDGPGAKPRASRAATAPRTGAYNLPGGIGLIGFRGDAIYLTGDPLWADDGKPGRYRVKADHLSFTMPATLAELDVIRRGDKARPSGPAAARAALRKVTR